MRPSIATLFVPLMAVFIVVVAAGSLRRKGTWSTGTYYGVVAVTLVVAAGAMVTWWMRRPG